MANLFELIEKYAQLTEEELLNPTIIDILKSNITSMLKLSTNLEFLSSAITKVSSSISSSQEYSKAIKEFINLKHDSQAFYMLSEDFKSICMKQQFNQIQTTLNDVKDTSTEIENLINEARIYNLNIQKFQKVKNAQKIKEQAEKLKTTINKLATSISTLSNLKFGNVFVLSTGFQKGALALANALLKYS